jgi:hypothetical protein
MVLRDLSSLLVKIAWRPDGHERPTPTAGQRSDGTATVNFYEPSTTSRGVRDMGLEDRWEDCMHTMHMPTPTEAWHSAEEAIEKLHEIDLALGGVGLLEAAEHLKHMGVVVRVGAQAAAVTVSWWVGNAVGCTITAAFGEEIADAIDYLRQPLTWTWVEEKMNEVNYPIPSIEFRDVEETGIRSSSTTQDDPPPHPVIDRACDEAEWVRYLQRLLVEQHGYQIEIDGDFGPATAAAVRDFKQRHNLGSGTEVDHHTWRALEAVASR